jgi:hypothetical protein
LIRNAKNRAIAMATSGRTSKMIPLCRTAFQNVGSFHNFVKLSKPIHLGGANPRQDVIAM